jgi:hypothetical protein
VEPADLPAWAEKEAARLLANLGDRWKHVRSVAAQAERASVVLPSKDRPCLIAAAWLHDIGYAPPLAKLGFHPVDGARYVRRCGQERLASLVAYHSGARIEAEERGLVEELATFEPEEGAVLDALTFADMTTGPRGEPMTLNERVAEILDRYPPDDPVHRSVVRSLPLLDEAIARTTRRLAHP